MEYAVTLGVHGIKAPDEDAIEIFVDLLAEQGAIETRGPGVDRWSVTLTVEAHTIDDAVTEAVAGVAAAASTAHMPLSNVDALEVLSIDERQRRLDLDHPGRHRNS